MPLLFSFAVVQYGGGIRGHTGNGMLLRTDLFREDLRGGCCCENTSSVFENTTRWLEEGRGEVKGRTFHSCRSCAMFLFCCRVVV